MKGPSLKVGSQPAPAELQTYLAGLDKNAKLKAKQDPQGNTILYASTKRSGLFDRMTGRAAQKRDAARQLINRTLQHLETHAQRGAVNEDMREPATNAFREIRTFLKISSNTALRVKAAYLGLETGKAVVAAAPHRIHEKSTGPLHKLGDLQAPCDLAARHLEAGNRDEAMKSLGDAIGQAVRDHFTDEEKDAFAFSAGVGLRQKIGAALEQALGDDFDKALPPGKDRDSFLREAVFHASGQILANKQIDENTIQMGGETYTKLTDEKHPDGKIGVGGFADVYLYQRQKDDGSVEKIAVKFSRPAPDDSELDKQLSEFGHEVLVHKAAVQSGSDNIIGLKGGFAR